MADNGNRIRRRSRRRQSNNPRGRVYTSNGPGLTIRGTAAQITEKYLQEAKDAGDNKESLLQHADHWRRIDNEAIAAHSAQSNHQQQ